jgi:phosphohistidine phosphatase SixA
MACGCKKKKPTTQQTPMTIVLNETNNSNTKSQTTTQQTTPDNQVDELIDRIKQLTNNQ